MERRDFLAGTAAVGTALADSPEARAAKGIEGLPAAADMV